MGQVGGQTGEREAVQVFAERSLFSGEIGSQVTS